MISGNPELAHAQLLQRQSTVSNGPESLPTELHLTKAIIISYIFWKGILQTELKFLKQLHSYYKAEDEKDMAYRKCVVWQMH